MGIDQLTTITIDDVVYYNASDVKTADPAFFIGTSRSIRYIIAKKNIPKDVYVYANNSKRNGWRKATNQDKPASKCNLLLSKVWVDANVPVFADQANGNDVKYEYPVAPPLLHLNDEEMFHDTTGKSINIETRGERTARGIYFKAKDVADAFEIDQLSTVICKSEIYTLDDDYKTFMCTPYTNCISPTYKKHIYLTYAGVLRTLYTTRSKAATQFTTWATNTLFAAHMGTREQKIEMVGGILGVPTKSLTTVLDKSSVSVPSVYLYALGTVKDLRTSMSLPSELNDNHTIVKFGLTKNLTQRAKQHAREYSKIDGATVELLEFVYIDPKYLSEAEVVIKDYFRTIEHPVTYKSYTELMCIDPTNRKQISEKYELIHRRYAGCTLDMTSTIAELKVELATMRAETEVMKKSHEWELRDKDRIIEQRDLIIANKEKDNEILRLQLQLAMR